MGHSVANDAMFLRSCVALTPSSEDRPRHSLNALVKYCEYDEELIFLVLYQFKHLAIPDKSRVIF